MSELNRGDRVYDSTTPAYEVIELLDAVAKDVVAKEEKKDRGHVIYEEKTVADLNSQFPETDQVVRVRRLDTGREVLWPISRVAHDVSELK